MKANLKFMCQDLTSCLLRFKLIDNKSQQCSLVKPTQRTDGWTDVWTTDGWADRPRKDRQRRLNRPAVVRNCHLPIVQKCRTCIYYYNYITESHKKLSEKVKFSEELWHSQITVKTEGRTDKVICRELFAPRTLKIST